MRRHKIDELADVEFEGSLKEAIYLYSIRMYDIGLCWQVEAELAAADLQIALETLHSNPLFMGLDTYWKARRVAKRARRQAELAFGLAKEAEAAYNAYMKHVYYALGGGS